MTPSRNRSACVFRIVANDPADSVYPGGSVNPGQNLVAFIGSNCCQRCPRSPCPPGGIYVYTFAPGLHRNFGKSANEYPGRNGHNCSIGGICTEICTDQGTHLHHLPGTESMPAGASDLSSGLCEIRTGANMPDIPEDIRRIGEPAAYGGFSWCKFRCKRVQTGAKVQTTAPVNSAAGSSTLHSMEKSIGPGAVMPPSGWMTARR